MSKSKELRKDVSDLAKSILVIMKKHTTVSTDLYASIKEVAELKYRNVELEARLANLEAMVKILNEKGG